MQNLGTVSQDDSRDQLARISVDETPPPSRTTVSTLRTTMPGTFETQSSRALSAQFGYQSGGPMGGIITAVLVAGDRLKDVAKEHPSRLEGRLWDEDCGRDRKEILHPLRLFVPTALSEPGSEVDGWLVAVQLQRRSIRVATTAAGEGQILQPDDCEGIRREDGTPDARRGAGAASQVASNADGFGRSTRAV
ncbi:hypothetical protein LTR66_013263 [Elasticomyces elasticus]|nr:hypothetical protein LTR66_013263 [Elasticomyces elasticus]